MSGLELKAVMSAAFLVFCPICYVHVKALCIAGNLIQLKVWRTKCQIENSRTRRYERQRFPAVVCKLYQLIIFELGIVDNHSFRGNTCVLKYGKQLESSLILNPSSRPTTISSSRFCWLTARGYVPLIWLCRVRSTEDGNCRKINVMV